MALSQIVWNHMTGTEDQLFEDCMKIQNEPKRVGIYILFNSNSKLYVFVCGIPSLPPSCPSLGPPLHFYLVQNKTNL